MPGLLSSRRALLLYLLVWLLLGLMLAAALETVAGAPRLASLVFAVPLTLVYAFAAGFSAYFLCRAYPLAERHPVEIVVTFALAALLSGAVWLALARLWNGMWLSLAADWAAVPMTRAIAALVFGMGVLLYGLAAVGFYLAVEFERARHAERRELESQLTAQDAELRLLRTQIEPHFLFNSLNSISALTSIAPARAREMTLGLADFFRLSLQLGARRSVTLAEEMELVRQFLAIEQVRFGARLTVEYDIAPEAESCLVPPMLIQPLVENAVKHGIGQLPDGGTIAVRAQRDGSRVRIRVANPVDADALRAPPAWAWPTSVRACAPRTGPTRR
jgi:two-component system sensor histidine kinase AlgZ